MRLATLTSEKTNKRILNLFSRSKSSDDVHVGEYNSESLLINDRLSILSDVRDESGILFTKMDLGELFTFEPDIFQFNNAEKQNPILTSGSSIVEKLNQYETDLTPKEDLVYSPIGTPYDDELVELFKQTCILLGFSNLHLSEVSLYKSDDYLIIETSPFCIFYSGSLKVKIK